MHTEVLAQLPAAENTFHIALNEGERVVYTMTLHMLGTETDEFMGKDCSFTMTNQRIIIDNGVSTWTGMIAEDVLDCQKVVSGSFLMKMTYFLLSLKEEVTYAKGKTFKGFRLYVKKKDIARFEEIVHLLFGK